MSSRQEASSEGWGCEPVTELDGQPDLAQTVRIAIEDLWNKSYEAKARSRVLQIANIEADLSKSDLDDIASVAARLVGLLAQAIDLENKIEGSEFITPEQIQAALRKITRRSE